MSSCCFTYLLIAVSNYEVNMFICSWIFHCVKLVTDVGSSMNMASLLTWTQTQSLTSTLMRCWIKWLSGRNKLIRTAVCWVIMFIFYFFLFYSFVISMVKQVNTVQQMTLFCCGCSLLNISNVLSMLYVNDLMCNRAPAECTRDVQDG